MKRCRASSIDAQEPRPGSLLDRLGVALTKRVLGMLTTPRRVHHEVATEWTFEAAADVLEYCYYLPYHLVSPRMARIVTEMVAARVGAGLTSYENFHRASDLTPTSLNRAMAAYLKQNGLPVSGPKHELWQRIQRFQRRPIPRPLQVKMDALRACAARGLRGPAACRRVARANKACVLLSLRLHDCRRRSGYWTSSPYRLLRNHLTFDLDVLRAALRNDGSCLSVAPTWARDDDALVRLAVAQNGSSLYSASRRLRNTREMLLLASETYSAALGITDIYKLRNDEELVWKCLRKSPHCYHLISRRLKLDQAILDFVLSKSGRLLESVPDVRARFSLRNVVNAAGDAAYPDIVLAIPDIYKHCTELATVLGRHGEGKLLGYFTEAVQNDEAVRRVAALHEVSGTDVKNII